jgi:hypothetical protein
MKATTVLLSLSALVSTAVATPIVQREGMFLYLPFMTIIGI